MSSKRRRTSKRRNSQAGAGNTFKSPANRVNLQTSKSGQSRAKTPAQTKNNFERYTALARSAAAAGDTVGAENYYQHAEHYYRQMKQKAA